MRINIRPGMIFVCLQATTLIAASLVRADNMRPTIQVPPGDCSAINQAIQSLPAAGGNIVLQAGNYLCNKPIVIDRDNVSVAGAGKQKTLIKAADARPMPVVIIGSAVNKMADGQNYPLPDHVTKNIELSGVTINGNYKSHPHPGDVECYDPKTDQSMNCGTDGGLLIRNNSLTIRRTEHAKIRDIETLGAYSGGIVLEKKNVDILMTGFSAHENYFDGFAGYETAQSYFTDFDVSRNQFSGISVDWGFEGNIFNHGTLADNGDNGVFSSDVGHNIYVDLDVRNNHGLGIYIAGYFDKANGNKPMAGTCDGNRIADVRVDGPKAGIVINSPCQNTLVEKAHIKQAQMNCNWNFPGADVTIDRSTCTDGSRIADLLK